MKIEAVKAYLYVRQFPLSLAQLVNAGLSKSQYKEMEVQHNKMNNLDHKVP